MLSKGQVSCQKDLSQGLSLYADSQPILSDEMLLIVQLLDSRVYLLDSLL